ncbi:branched-chain amino acid ABC transporter permease [Halovulum dunhuangense]|uniref:Branched-chain amino acid ABC transporter permease n=1 Tax=Halovulum dunhuangense TaxID=1505036 RepID=A0A849L1L8_9RHOB|nr:branched-chain amino acid ABC transporter permease [Halovulum dunhuangense]NNU80186.1 branched-chain amino acid ABC transporter permease [Halovulum dunhuangense]
MARAGLADALVLALLIGTALTAQFMGQPYLVTLATKAAILGLAGVGLNLALGYGGMVSFGHAAYFGLGGYAAGVLASHAMSGQPLPFGFSGTNQMLAIWPVAMILSGLAALVIGALSLRTRGVYFIMVTLAFAQMLFYFAISWPAYGGEDGLSFYVRNSFPGLNTFAPLQFFAICAGLLMLALGLTAMLTASRFGLALQAARQNPGRARALGIRPFPLQLTAFVLSGMITGLAGALYADLNRFVSPAMMSWQMSGEIMVFVILGGVARLAGPLAGAMVFILLEHLLGGVSEHWLALVGLLLLAIVLFAPGGILGLAERRRHG